MATRPEPPHEDLVAAVLRLADLAGRVERAEASTGRLDDVARDCAAAMRQISEIRGDLGALGGRADEIEQKLAGIGGVLDRMAGQITDLAANGDGRQPGSPEPYTVTPAPPWWKPADPRCQDTTERLAAWVDQVYRPVYGYLAGLLAPCWAQHPLCMAYLDTLHEAWCLLYLTPRDPKLVFAQLDWLTRPLLQAAEVMATETRPCRDRGRHQPSTSPTGRVPSAPQDGGRSHRGRSPAGPGTGPYTRGHGGDAGAGGAAPPGRPADPRPGPAAAAPGQVRPGAGR